MYGISFRQVMPEEASAPSAISEDCPREAQKIDPCKSCFHVTGAPAFAARAGFNST